MTAPAGVPEEVSPCSAPSARTLISAGPGVPRPSGSRVSAWSWVTSARSATETPVPLATKATVTGPLCWSRVRSSEPPSVTNPRPPSADLLDVRRAARETVVAVGGEPAGRDVLDHVNDLLDTGRLIPPGRATWPAMRTPISAWTVTRIDELHPGDIATRTPLSLGEGGHADFRARRRSWFSTSGSGIPWKTTQACRSRTCRMF